MGTPTLVYACVDGAMRHRGGGALAGSLLLLQIARNDARQPDGGRGRGALLYSQGSADFGDPIPPACSDSVCAVHARTADPVES